MNINAYVIRWHAVSNCSFAYSKNDLCKVGMKK